MSPAGLVTAVGETIGTGIGAGSINRNMLCRDSLQLTLPLHHQLIVDVVFTGLLIEIYEFVPIAEGFEAIANVLIDFEFFLTDGRTDDNMSVVWIAVLNLNKML